MKKEDLIGLIEEIAPRSLEEKWDNCGMQINCGNIEVDKLLISLEITGAVIDEAEELKADFILTHHPLIFQNLSFVDNNDIIGNYIFRLIRGGISVYSAHTTFDSAYGGNNDFLAAKLELMKIRRFKGKLRDSEGALLGRMGDFKNPCSLEETCKYIEKKLDLKHKVRFVGDPDKIIHTAGICTGAGSDLLSLAKICGCDLFITGDLKHHDALWAKEAGIAVIDAGHYGTEKLFAVNMAGQLKKESPQLEIIESKVCTNPFTAF